MVTPLLALVIPADQALGIMLPVLILGDFFALGLYWRAWDKKIFWLMMVGGVVGVILGTTIIANISASLLGRGLALLIFLFVAYRVFENRLKQKIHYQDHSFYGVLAGTAAGFMSSIGHAGGPPVSMYLLMKNLQPAVFVATTAIFFTALNWIKMPFYISAGLINIRDLLGLWFLLPFVPLGVWAGKLLIDWIDKMLFEKIITIILFGTAIILWMRA